MCSVKLTVYGPVEGDLRACYLNSETMPYTGLGFGSCAGDLYYVTHPHQDLGTVKYYSCERHMMPN